MQTKQLQQDKRVPWSQYLDYIQVHNELIDQYVTLSNSGDLQKHELEVLLPESFMQLYQHLQKLLINNQIISSDLAQTKIEGIVNHILRLQEAYFSHQDRDNPVDLQRLILNMRSEFAQSVQGLQQQEIEQFQGIVQNMSGKISQQFSKQYSRIDQLENQLKSLINQRNGQEIEELKQDNRSKEQIIQQLRQLEGELKAKNEEVEYLKQSMMQQKMDFNETVANKQGSRGPPIGEQDSSLIQQLLEGHEDQIRSLTFQHEKQIKELRANYENQIQQLQTIYNIQPQAEPQQEIIKNFLVSSKCTFNDEEKVYLRSLFPYNYMITNLLYRGSRDGWNDQDFHQRCNNKSPTITLFKIKDGPCAGGFTTVQWSSPLPLFPQRQGDSKAMLFNLTNKRVFPVRDHSNAIYLDKSTGPGFGSAELKAYTSPFNGYNNCRSYANRAYYLITTDSQGRNMLTNQLGEHFTCLEIEVWQVIIQ